MSTRLYAVFLHASSAFSPLSTTSHSTPICLSILVITIWFTALSSATSTFHAFTSCGTSPPSSSLNDFLRDPPDSLRTSGDGGTFPEVGIGTGAESTRARLVGLTAGRALLSSEVLRPLGGRNSVLPSFLALTSCC